MKQRYWIVFLALLVGCNLFTEFTNQEFKKSLAHRISYAYTYYKERARHYYQLGTGQIPPRIICDHYREWKHFEIVCDALLLNKQQSVDLFANFIDAIARQFQRIVQNKQLISDPPPEEKGIHPYWKVYQGVIALFREDQKGNFTPDELDLICELIRYPRIVPDTDVRALRKVSLDDGQHNALRPYCMQVVQSLIRNDPECPWSIKEAAGFPHFETVKSAFLSKANELLTEEQIEKWNAAHKQAQQSINDYRERFYNIPDYYYSKKNHSKKKPADVMSKL